MTRLPDDAGMRGQRIVGVVAGAVLVAGAGVGAPAAAAAVERYPVPADGIFRIEGHGWGHGRGLSQWGAYQAAAEGRTAAQSLAFYYPGTTLTPAGPPAIRVWLTSDTGRDLVVRARPGLAAGIGSAAVKRLAVRPAGCRSNATSWRVRTTKAGLTLSAYCRAWRTVATTKTGSVRFSSSSGIVQTKNGSARRGYRGVVGAVRISATSVRVVNTLPMEQYLRTVVPAESTPSWPTEALRAQSIAARTYAAVEAARRKGGGFDVYDSTRSQVYPAAFAYSSSWRVTGTREHASTDAAIRATARVLVTRGTVPVLTQFSSSNGGVSASSPLPHMISRVDPWDARATRNPRLAWTDSISARTLRARYPSVGTVRSLEVVSREGLGPFGGRVTQLRIVGSAGSRTVSGDTAIRAALGTNSSLLTFTG